MGGRDVCRQVGRWVGWMCRHLWVEGTDLFWLKSWKCHPNVLPLGGQTSAKTKNSGRGCLQL